VTLNQARVTAQKVFAARLDGRDLAAEKKDSRRRMVADRVEDLLEAFIAQPVSQNRSALVIAAIASLQPSRFSLTECAPYLCTESIADRSLLQVGACHSVRSQTLSASKSDDNPIPRSRVRARA